MTNLQNSIKQINKAALHEKKTNLGEFQPRNFIILCGWHSVYKS